MWRQRARNVLVMTLIDIQVAMCPDSGENRRNDERAESSVFRVNFDGFDSSVRAQIDGFPLKDN
jgi:hypothetical protein